MIETKKYVLENGLRVILHSDKSTPLVALNILYDIGSKHEDPNQTGLAHLFEHLMFSGSRNAKDFDTPIQNAGGENNAFTNADMTNFYSIVPKNNLDILLWLESDRMSDLIISNDSLEIQKSVVVEEFNETCLNEPYGDLWHHLSALAYKRHHYKWPTIGKIPQHISDTKLKDVMHFYKKNYNPSNAILSIAGNIDYDLTIEKVRNWFGHIEGAVHGKELIPSEDKQRQLQELHHNSQVPNTALYFCFHMVGRQDPDYYATDLISDILSHGRSSRLYKNLYKQGKYFQSIDAYITGTLDPGLMIIDSKIQEHHNLEDAKQSIWSELDRFVDKGLSDEELQKVKNKAISTIAFSEMSVLNKAINLSFYELCGDRELINQQEQMYNSVRVEDIERIAEKILCRENCSILSYGPEPN